MMAVSTRSRSRDEKRKISENTISVKPAQQQHEKNGVHMEFGGPFGAAGIMLFSHAILYYFWYCLEFNEGGISGPKFTSLFSAPAELKEFVSIVMAKAVIHCFPTLYAWKIYLTYVSLEILLAFVMPGIWIKGYPVPSERNQRLSYLCNALWSWYAFLLIGMLLHFSRVWRVTELADNYGAVMTVAVIVGNVMALLVYVSARIQKKENRMTGNFLYDFFMGIYLNPRIGYFDLKMWAEIRISWKLLFFLTISAAAKQYELYGTVTWPMIFMVTAHFLYTNACQKGEECIPTTWDIFYENWGWMIIFWNFAGVPFVYTFQSYYILKQQPYHFHPLLQALHFLLLFSAYYVWDTANSQKNRYRMEKEGTLVKRQAFPQLPYGTLENPRTLQDNSGHTLLVDGWWAYARKIHYFADILMGKLRVFRENGTKKSKASTSVAVDSLEILRRLKSEKRKDGIVLNTAVESSVSSEIENGGFLTSKESESNQNTWKKEQLFARTWTVFNTHKGKIRSLTLLEDPLGAYCAGNGATLWDSGIALAGALQEQSRINWKGRSVIELGAGIGLVSMTLASLGANVLATERRLTLPILERNVLENQPFADGSLRTLELDWTNVSWDMLPMTEYFVGSDLVFPSNKPVQEALSKVILTLVKVRKQSGWISHEPRNKEVDSQFWGKLEQQGVAVRKLASSELPNEFPSELIIYKLKIASKQSGK